MGEQSREGVAATRADQNWSQRQLKGGAEALQRERVGGPYRYGQHLIQVTSQPGMLHDAVQHIPQFTGPATARSSSEPPPSTRTSIEITPRATAPARSREPVWPERPLPVTRQFLPPEMPWYPRAVQQQSHVISRPQYETPSPEPWIPRAQPPKASREQLGADQTPSDIPPMQMAPTVVSPQANYPVQWLQRDGEFRVYG
ncbi:unnamed protein product [Gongylonema pulchrum]|uniref:ZM domain-containing protein n=1 Tax=Gongylonema pulchrum TaxID=637853 RepID=A0A183EQ02_9BILA|nr:unnamed protein product [Gongylonema pulchrum]